MTISKLIAKTGEWDDCIMYKAISSCNCCDMSIMLEVDEDTKMLEVSFHKKVGMYSEYQELWWKELWERIRMACRILFLGQTEMEGSFYFEDKEQLDDYVLALQEGMRKMKNKRLEDEMKSEEVSGCCGEIDCDCGCKD